MSADSCFFKYRVASYTRHSLRISAIAWNEVKPFPATGCNCEGLGADIAGRNTPRLRHTTDWPLSDETSRVRPANTLALRFGQERVLCPGGAAHR